MQTIISMNISRPGFLIPQRMLFVDGLALNIYKGIKIFGINVDSELTFEYYYIRSLVSSDAQELGVIIKAFIVFVDFVIVSEGSYFLVLDVLLACLVRCCWMSFCTIL